MNRQQCINVAQFLLDGEFEAVNNDPVSYCASMGWNSNSDGTNRARNKKGKLAPSADDVQNLASIIESIDSEDTLEISESNTVSDFLSNCVATHIAA